MTLLKPPLTAKLILQNEDEEDDDDPGFLPSDCTEHPDDPGAWGREA